MAPVEDGWCVSFQDGDDDEREVLSPGPQPLGSAQMMAYEHHASNDDAREILSPGPQTLGSARAVAYEHHASIRRDEGEFALLGVAWSELPLRIRQMWWRETNYNRTPPTPEFMARLPQELAAAQREVEDAKR